MVKYDRTKWVTWALLIILILASFYNVWLLIDNQKEISGRIQNSVIAEVSKIVFPEPEHGRDGKDAEVTEEQLARAVARHLAAHPIKNGENGQNGLTPVKNVDYFDGKTPLKNVDYFDGDDGYTPVKDVDYFDGANGTDGRTLYMRCNTEKNRWEQRYEGDGAWSIQPDQNGKPVKCTTAVIKE